MTRGCTRHRWEWTLACWNSSTCRGMFSRSNHHDQTAPSANPAAAPTLLASRPPAWDSPTKPQLLSAHFSRLESLLDSALATLTLIRDHAPNNDQQVLSSHAMEVLQALCRHTFIPAPDPGLAPAATTSPPLPPSPPTPPAAATYAAATAVPTRDGSVTASIADADADIDAAGHTSARAQSPTPTPTPPPTTSDILKTQNYAPDLIFRLDDSPHTIPLPGRPHSERLCVAIRESVLPGTGLRILSVRWTQKGNLTVTFLHDAEFTRQAALKLAPAIWKLIRPLFKLPKQSACPRIEQGGSWHTVVIHSVPVAYEESKQSVRDWLWETSVLGPIGAVSVMCDDNVLSARIGAGGTVSVRVSLVDKADADSLLAHGAIVLGARCRVSRYIAKPRSKSMP
ncbi:hypothetical protein MSAN_01834400 [Mycena sanguinolenta]|uniref:Uncharacterized protein n=1 Tax=Mycena sanguinolenta TaxID=230812 RepID=A0A8H6XQF0_9AGAR|nr:hypothetical protein MSAN_01834400 [Mycena sanguinolenta]